MRPHTGRGSSGVNLPQHACLVRGSVRLHANRLLFYFGLACKGPGARPHCNTRSHRLHGLTSLGRYKAHRGPPRSTTSMVISLDLPHLPPGSSSLISVRLTRVSSDWMFANQSAENTSANPLVRRFYFFVRETVVIVEVSVIPPSPDGSGCIHACF